ncbi:MAG: T9SS type A sorting domain-containing protein, partial [Bacteroidota bacterium]|nr:T9SS type A sorting domain-containing protein [Bacteroidota bacterium]
QTTDIALMERLNHERLMNADKATGASNNFDVKYYRCEWEVDPAVRFIKGKVTVYFVTTADASSISLDLMSALITDSIKQRKSLLTYQHTNNVLQINLATTISSGKLDSVSIFYAGIPPTSGFGSFIQTTHSGIPVIWTLSEPYGSRDWWPCKNGLDDKADSIDIFVSHPSQYKAASNGLLQSETASGINKITHWKHRYPIATYLVCFAVTNYAVFNNSVQLGNINLPMQTFCYPENLTLFQTNTPLVLNALQLYNNIFGEYPFIKEKYGHVQFGWGGGQEHQTSTFIITPDEGLMAHELAHQWFGDKVTCASWQEIWLNEGFATHLASMYMEQNYPANTINNRRTEITNITSNPGGSVWVDDTTNVSRIFDGRLSYRKGSHLLYMLRWILGDSIFFKSIRQYHTDAKLQYGFAKTDDLKRNLESVSGKDLTSFFKEWFYGQGYPSYNVQWSQIGNDYVKIKMQQTTSHASVSFFELPVALKFKNATQEKTIVVDNKFNGEIFYKNIGFIADTVLIDPDYWLITKNNTSQKVADNISGQNVVQVFPNPVQSTLSIYIRNYKDALATLSIYNSAGQVLYKKQLFINGSQFIEIPVAYLSSGVYFIHLRSVNETKFVKKIVKQ